MNLPKWLDFDYKLISINVSLVSQKSPCKKNDYVIA